jgi:uncharacterized membrane protein YGL010W
VGLLEKFRFAIIPCGLLLLDGVIAGGLIALLVYALIRLHSVGVVDADVVLNSHIAIFGCI